MGWKDLAKRLKTTIFTFVTLAFGVFLNVPAAYGFSGSGAGTTLNPYQITTCAQFEDMNSNLSASYKLMNDLDCSGTLFTPIGSASTGGLAGTFDGGSHTITGITVSQPADYDVGIFGFIEGGSISNLNITNSSVQGLGYVGVLTGGTNGFGSVDHVTITDSGAMGQSMVGGMFGSLFQFSINDVHTANTTVNGTNPSGTTSEIGGLAGEINGADVTRAYVLGGGVTGNIDDNTQSQHIGGFVGEDGNGSNVSDSFTTANVSGHNYVGGFSGDINDTAYATSYASGNVNGDNYVGGFTGRLQTGSIGNSFAVGHVSGFTIGGLVGQTSAGYGGSISNSAWDVTRSGQTDCVGDLGITIDCSGVNVANADPNHFMNNHTNAPLSVWDFTSLWRTNATGYPSFQTTPQRPDNVRVTRISTALTASWDYPADDGGSAVTSYDFGYRLYGSSDAFIFTNGIPASKRTAIISNLLPDTQYEMEVRANNAHGNGVWLGFYTSTLPVVTLTTSSSPTSTTSSTVKPVVIATSSTPDGNTSATTSADPNPVPTGTTPQKERQEHMTNPIKADPTKDSTKTILAVLGVPVLAALLWFGIKIFL